jgi:hypothetical protein
MLTRARHHPDRVQCPPWIHGKIRPSTLPVHYESSLQGILCTATNYGITTGPDAFRVYQKHRQKLPRCWAHESDSLSRFDSTTGCSSRRAYGAVPALETQRVIVHSTLVFLLCKHCSNWLPSLGYVWKLSCLLIHPEDWMFQEACVQHWRYNAYVKNF